MKKRIYFETTDSGSEASLDSNGKLPISRVSGYWDLEWRAGLAPKNETVRK